MKSIAIQNLSILNFKGCREFTLELNGRSASIYGDNATGKSTIYDAFTWLLFGKDSAGSTKFNVKPLNKGGEVADHGATTEVSATLIVDGEQITLKRSLSEIWTKKRGFSEAVFSGNATEYAVNDVPMKENAYKAAIADIVDEDTFRILTNLTWFVSGMKDAERRAVLFDLCGAVSDMDILQGDADYAPLVEALNGRSIEDMKKVLSARRKQLNTNRNTIPARIDECSRTVKEYESLDFNELRVLRECANQRWTTAHTAINSSASDGSEALREKRKAIAMQIDALARQNAAFRESQKNPTRIEILEKQIAHINQMLKDYDSEKGRLDMEQIRLEQQLSKSRTAWADANKRKFSGGTCPTCKQKLPEQMLLIAKSTFEEQKNNDKADAMEAGSAAKKRLEEIAERLEEIKENADSARQDLKQTEAALKSAKNAKATDMDGYAEQTNDLCGQLTKIDSTLKTMDEASRESLAKLLAEREAAADDLKKIDSALAGEQVLQNAMRRRAELEEEERSSGAELEAVDELIDLCERFTLDKARFIEQSVDGHFQLVKWQLFEQQINGGIRDCCKPTVNGVPYADLNNGMKINAGLDVIRAISSAREVQVPLFIDNAESVTAIEHMDCQTIRLVVNADYKTLRSDIE